MKDTLSAFKNRFVANRRKIWEMDQYLLEDLSFLKWRDALIERSNITRDIFRENEKFIREINSELNDDIDEGTAEDLFDAVTEIYNGGCDDLFLMKNLALPAIKYYEKKGDYTALSYLYKIMGFENFEFYGRVDKNKGSEEAVQYYEKVVALSDHYSEIEDVSARANIFTAYNNLIAPVGQTTYDLKCRMFGYYRDAVKLWNQESVQKLDGENEDFKSRMAQIEADVLFAEEFIEEMPEEYRREFVELETRIKDKWEHDHKPDDEGILFRSDIKRRMLEGESGEKLIDEIVDHLDHLGDPDYENDEEGALLKVMDYHNSGCVIFDIFRYENFPRNKRKEIMDRFCNKATNVQLRIPFGFWTELMDEMCAEWFTEMAPFMEDRAEKISLMLKLVISRQPITYIHSLMVSEIAVRIARTIIRDDPSFFAGTPDYKTITDVVDRQEELRDYISECGLLHDCGKCEIVEVVNRQDRRIYDEEYDVIKIHPDKGYEMLKHDPNFACFYDVIRGHHKSYDGKSGYPEEFDNSNSEYKPFIDLITISDCIDAATDILGRNYTHGKEFAEVFEELKQGSGTRYNPHIVYAIERDTALFDDLKYITREGRFDIYFRAYKEILVS